MRTHIVTWARKKTWMPWRKRECHGNHLPKLKTNTWWNKCWPNLLHDQPTVERSCWPSSHSKPTQCGRMATMIRTRAIRTDHQRSIQRRRDRASEWNRRRESQRRPDWRQGHERESVWINVVKVGFRNEDQKTMDGHTSVRNSPQTCWIPVKLPRCAFPSSHLHWFGKKMTTDLARWLGIRFGDQSSDQTGWCLIENGKTKHKARTQLNSEQTKIRLMQKWNDK
jgi:hypothetical protein